MSNVVIIGAGLGGLSGAYEMHKALGNQHKVIVINERESFRFVPSNPWLAVGWRVAEQISFPIRPYLESKGIEFIAARRFAIRPTAVSVNSESIYFEDHFGFYIRHNILKLKGKTYHVKTSMINPGAKNIPNSLII
jgi:NADH dehydrogenase FAD-containing subunit